MKITAILFILLVLFLPASYPQEYTQINLPEGAAARLGRGSIYTVAYFPDGERLAVGTSIGIWVYDTTTYPVEDSPETGSERDQRGEGTLLTGHTGKVYCILFSPDGKTFASGSEDHTIRLWDAETGKTKAVLAGHTNEVKRVLFSPDGKTLASVSKDETIRLWDTVTGKPKRVLANKMNNVSFSPDGKTLAGGEWEVVWLWDAETGEVTRTLTGHIGVVYGVAYSPDGRTIASGSTDKTVRLWDAETGELKRVLTGHTGEVTSIAFSVDGRTLVSGSGDGTVVLWKVH